VDALMGADADAQCNTDDGQRSSTAAVLAGRATTLPETAAVRDEPSGPAVPAGANRLGRLAGRACLPGLRHRRSRAGWLLVWPSTVR